MHGLNKIEDRTLFADSKWIYIVGSTLNVLTIPWIQSALRCTKQILAMREILFRRISFILSFVSAVHHAGKLLLPISLFRQSVTVSVKVSRNPT